MPSYENEAPSADVADDSYVSRAGHKNEEVPVQADGDLVEDPIDETKADTDEQLSMFLSFMSFIPLVLITSYAVLL